jgi:DNA-binding beta-propeller fold protein YncE
MSSRIAVDAVGRVYVSNGEFDVGRIYVFDSELNELWSVPITNINIGGPAIAADGTMIVCGNGTNVRAYRVEAPDCPEDLDGSGVVDVTDLLALLADWGGSGVPADINGDGIVDIDDLLLLLAAWGAC